MLPPRAVPHRRPRHGGALITKIVTALLLALTLASAAWSTSHSVEGEPAAITAVSSPVEAPTPAAHPEAGAVWTEATDSGAGLCLLGALCGLLILAIARAWSGRRPHPGLAAVDSTLRRVIRASRSLPPPRVSLSLLSISRT